MNFEHQTKLLINNQNKWQKMQEYVQAIENHNAFFNLTGFKGERLWEEGIYQSLKCLQDKIPQQKVKLLDIGAGVGFPSIPIKILIPDIVLTIYEPIMKRVKFLKMICEKLKLDVNILPLRAEESHDKETFDFVTARAVAPLKVLIEITHHLAKIGGQFIFLKGPNVQQEIKDAKQIINFLKLQITVEKIIINQHTINLIKYTKTHKTPIILPRSWKNIISGKNSKFI